MKIKIIDLLVKMANREELPKKIKYNDNIYYLFESRVDLHTYQTMWSNTTRRLSLIIDNEYLNLNDYIEIIEEPKKIEKIKMYQDGEGHYFLNKQDRKVYVNCDEMDFMVDKFNELIDEINNLKEK